jgi:tRNA dimethylallyltransferase
MWKTIFITGPTASGKSNLAIYLAKKFNGEIINADSRQVYKYLDVGSGKWDMGKKVKIQKVKNTIQINGVTFHLLNIANPKRNYSLGRWLKDADEAVRKIIKKGKVPIFCGGTILYLKAIKEGWVLPSVKPNYKLRKELEKKTNEELYKEIKKLDPQRAKNLDPRNKRRLIRALEIIYALGKVPKIKKDTKYEVLIIAPLHDSRIYTDIKRIHTDKLIHGLNRSNTDYTDNKNPHKSSLDPHQSVNKYPRESALDPRLSARIKRRLIKRVPGIIKEIKKLRRIGLSYKRIISFGLEYKWFGLYVQYAKDNLPGLKPDKLPGYQPDISGKHLGNKSGSHPGNMNLYEFVLNNCYKDILRFAKRQIRELRKIEGVVYVKNKKSAVKVVENFLKK